MGIAGYEEMEHPSDVGLRFRGKDPEGLFENAGLGMFSLITDISIILPSQKRELKISWDGGNLENMLIILLEKLLYCFEVEGMIFSRIDIKDMDVSGKKSKGFRAVLYGEKIDQEKHRIINTIKAPTYHLLNIERDAKDGCWWGSIIFDV